MDATKLNSDLVFKQTLITELIKVINDISMCEFPIVTELEVIRYLDKIWGDVSSRKKTWMMEFGNNRMDYVFYYVVDYCKLRYFNEILPYVNYIRKKQDNDSKSIKE